MVTTHAFIILSAITSFLILSKSSSCLALCWSRNWPLQYRSLTQLARPQRIRLLAGGHDTLQLLVPLLDGIPPLLLGVCVGLSPPLSVAHSGSSVTVVIICNITSAITTASCLLSSQLFTLLPVIHYNTILVMCSFAQASQYLKNASLLRDVYSI